MGVGSEGSSPLPSPAEPDVINPLINPEPKFLSNNSRGLKPQCPSLMVLTHCAKSIFQECFSILSRPIPEKEFVEAYVKAFYLTEPDMERWIREHKVCFP